jgi:hypothetical protein
MEREDPSVNMSIIDVFISEPQAALPKMLRELEQRMYARRDRAEPSDIKSTTLTPAMRAKPRTLMLDPISAKSSMETELPYRAMLLRDIVDPRWANCNTVSDDPHRA